MTDRSGEVFDGSLKRGKGEASGDKADFLRTALGRRVSRKVSSKSASLGNDCSETSLNYSARFPADDQTLFRFAVRVGQWAKIAI